MIVLKKQYRLILLLTVLFLPPLAMFMSAHTVHASEPIMMPAWFWQTPVEPGVLLSVGYSTPYANISSSYQEAYDSAAWRLFVDCESHVIGGRAMLETPEGMMSAGSKFDFIVDSSAFEGFAKSLVRIDSAATIELVVMLVGTKKIEVDTDWTIDPGLPELSAFKKEGYFVSLGTGQDYHYQSSSWEEAERSARREMALTFSEIKILEKDVNFYSSGTFLIETDIWLHNVQTLARSIDPETKHKTVIVRAVTY